MEKREVIIVGGGIAGLSAAIYLGRAGAGHARDRLGAFHGEVGTEEWRFLGFSRWSGWRGSFEIRAKAGFASTKSILLRMKSKKLDGEPTTASSFEGRTQLMRANRSFWRPASFTFRRKFRVRECLGHSMFFCKDCDGYRVRGKAIAVVGANNEAVEYTLGMLTYSPALSSPPMAKK